MSIVEANIQQEDSHSIAWARLYHVIMLLFQYIEHYDRHM